MSTAVSVKLLLVVKEDVQEDSEALWVDDIWDWLFVYESEFIQTT